LGGLSVRRGDKVQQTNKMTKVNAHITATSTTKRKNKKERIRAKKKRKAFVVKMVF